MTELIFAILKCVFFCLFPTKSRTLGYKYFKCINIIQVTIFDKFILFIFSGDELKFFQKEKAKTQCIVELLSCLERPITLAPLHMTQQKVESADELGHFHTRNEIPQTISKFSSGDIIVDNLFTKAIEHITSTIKRQYLDDEARENDISRLGNTVALIGQAGIGKTSLSKTILNRVLNEGLFDADFVFYLQFRAVNFKQNTNLLSFLGVDLPWAQEKSRCKPVLAKLAKSHIVMIFDGFDEAVLDPSTPCKKIFPWEKAKPETFIKNLLNGSIFPLAKKLITSRPRQLLALHPSIKPLYIVNITGLDIESQKDICKEICGKNADRIFNHIIHHPQIASYCYVPANCIFVMYVMGKIIQDKSSQDFPNSITGVLVIVIVLFAKSSHARINFSLKKLAELAWNGLKNRKFYFSEEDLQRAELCHEDVNFFCLTFLGIAKKDLPFFLGDPKKFTYFAHLIIQEFFAALRLIVFSTKTTFRKYFLGRKLFGLYFSKPDFDLFSSDWEVVAKFLFGLCNAKTVECLFNQFPSFASALPDKTKILCDFVLQSFPTNTLPHVDYFQQILQFCTWAYELNDHKFASRVAKRLENKLIVVGKFLPNDVAPLHYVLQHRKKPLHLETTPFDSWFVADSLDLFLEEVPKTIDGSIVSVIYLKLILNNVTQKSDL